MKGYLSRLARQSGMRLPQARFAPLALADAGDSAGLAAPEFEQHLMVAPEIPGPREPFGTLAASPAVRAQDSGRAHDEAPAPRPARAPAPPEARLPSVDSPAVAAVRAAADDAAHPPSRAAMVHATVRPGAAAQSSGPRVLEQTVLREASVPAPERLRDSDPPQSSNGESRAEAAAPAPEPREFFVRTAEMLGSGSGSGKVGGGGVTPEAQTILLREVQEWVAAAPLAPPAPPDPPARDAVRMTKLAPVREPEAAAPREPQRVELPVRPAPLEQSFELSIGSIDVTIEADEPPPAPAPRPSGRNDAPSTVGRRTSRLRRAYL